jgi:hypothetical protein
MSIRPAYVFILVAWPPAARTNYVRDFVEFAKDVEHVMTGYWRISVIGILFGLDGKHQARILERGDSAVVAWIEREKFHVASDLRLE